MPTPEGNITSTGTWMQPAPEQTPEEPKAEEVKAEEAPVEAAAEEVKAEEQVAETPAEEVKTEEAQA